MYCTDTPAHSLCSGWGSIDWNDMFHTTGCTFCWVSLVFTVFCILGYIVFNSKCLCVGGLYTKSHYFFPGATSPAEWCRCNCPSPDKRTRKLMKSDQLKSKLVWKYLGITSFNILPTGAAWQQDSFIEVWLSLWAPIDCYCQQKAVCYCYKSLNTQHSLFGTTFNY